MGSSNNASKEAQRAEAERQASITGATNRVNAVFDAPERGAQQQDFLSALREHYTGDLNRQKQVADRNLKFSLARGGLTGGSVARDTGKNLGEEYTRGILSAEEQAQGGLADLQARDESSRMNILSMVRSGLDATTAATRAGAAMQQSAAGARSGALAKGVGDIFTGTAGTYKRMEEGAARRAGQSAPVGSVYGSPFSR